MTPASADIDLVVDTSVAVALLVADHDHHADVTAAIGSARLGLAGHAAFETFSVLTRLPPPLRRAPATVSQMLARGFVDSRHLDPPAARDLLARLPALGIAGGAVYDALVGCAAVHHDLRLATRDRRALPTYRAVGAVCEVVAP